MKQNSRIPLETDVEGWTYPAVHVTHVYLKKPLSDETSLEKGNQQVHQACVDTFEALYLNSKRRKESFPAEIDEGLRTDVHYPFTLKMASNHPNIITFNDHIHLERLIQSPVRSESRSCSFCHLIWHDVFWCSTISQLSQSCDARIHKTMSRHQRQLCFRGIKAKKWSTILSPCGLLWGQVWWFQNALIWFEQKNGSEQCW